MAGFTGLSLLHGASSLPADRRKIAVSLAAIALGGGIWSMHFIAMLGMRLPIDFYYDPLTTLVSALIAILVVGLALLVLHFRERTAVTKTIAGVLIGVGILAMHYLGMSGIRRCLPLYTADGIAIAVIGSLLLSVSAVWIAYGERTRRNILIGTLSFGFAVFAVHFVAMAGTSFMEVSVVDKTIVLISNDTLAFAVALGSFLICGAFLLNTVTFGTSETAALQANDDNTFAKQPDEAPSPPSSETATEAAPKRELEFVQIPFERNGKTFFVSHEDVAAIRAEGHYTIVYSRLGKQFCPWSISEAVKRLPSGSFIRTHRSYLVNPRHVTGFERKKDNGVCFFDKAMALEKVPVSRSRLTEIKQSLGLA